MIAFIGVELRSQSDLSKFAIAFMGVESAIEKKL
jgi:hypothetical protein